MSMSSIRFVRDWRVSLQPGGTTAFRPFLPVLLRGSGGYTEREFLVDSGADLSMAPEELCRAIGLRWADGTPTTVQGISRRKTCAVAGRIHTVDLFVPDGGVVIRALMLFARGNAPYVLGRDGFFDLFEITFDMAARRTIFVLNEP